MNNYFNLFFTLIFTGFWCLTINKKDFENFIEKITEDDYFFILENMDKKADNNARLVIITLVSFVFIATKLGTYIFSDLLILAVIVVISWKGLYAFSKLKYRKKLNEVCLVFPGYLNNLAILVQQNPVANALEKSIEGAPSPLVPSLRILVEDIHSGKGKDGIVPYQEFANKFIQVEDISRIMKTLYSLAICTIDREKIVTSITKMANEKISINRKINFEKKLDQQILFAWLGFVWIGVVIIAMFFAINITSLGGSL